MSEAEALHERLMKLEELFSHQELLLGELHQELLSLRVEHDALAAKYRDCVERLESLAEGEPLDPNERPPHY